MLPLNSQHYQLIKDLTWDEVFEIWRENEETNPAWINHWQSKGFKSWQQWRQTMAEPWECSQRQWYLYKVNNPLVVAPQWRGGPFRTWRKFFYRNQNFATFHDIITGPHIDQHPGYQKMLSLFDNFPGNTTMTALLTNQGPVIIEGMHRGCALALAALNNKKLNTKIYLTIASAQGEELALSGQKPEDSGITLK
ncbi:MAG: hypothetical protein V1846_04675 [Candidatus Komeilibacteria bacterium]